MTSPRKARSGRWLSLLADGVLLLCALLGLFSSFITLYDFAPLSPAVSWIPPIHLDIVQLVRLAQMGALFALISLVVWSLPRFRTLAAVGCTGALAFAVYRLWASVSLGSRLVVSTIANQFADLVEWGTPLYLDLDPSLSSLDQREAVYLFFLLALALLALLVGWAVVRARRWWLVVAFTLTPLLPGLVADLYPHWPSFLLLAACWCAMLLTDLCKWAAPAGRGKLTLAVLPCVGVVLALISLALPMEGYSRPQWALQAEETLVSWGNQNLPFLSGVDGPFHLSAFVGSAENIDLSAAGPLRYTGRTVLEVTGDYEGRVYLRGAALADYEDNQWSALPDDIYANLSVDASQAFLAPARAVSELALGLRTITIENTGASGACVYAPYQLAEQNLDDAGFMLVNDTFLARRRGEWTQTVTFVPGALNLNLQAASSTSAAYTSFVSTYYLDVPEGLVPTLDTLLADLSTTDPVEAAQWVADRLSLLCVYDMATPAVPEGTDFVDYFLTESHRGYCMHFASAATLLLRRAGIPARYVSGFTAELTAGETVDIPDSAAHAWVEIYLDGYGWYPVEVTPAAALEEPGPDSSAAPSHSIAPDQTPSATPQPSATPAPEVSQPVASQPPTGGGGTTSQLLQTLGRVLLYLAAGAALCALVWLGQALPKALRRARLRSPDVNRAVLDCYRYLTRLKGWSGVLPGEALALARKARFSQYDLTEEERQTILALFDDQRAALRESLPPVKRLLFHYLWGWPAPEQPKENSAHDPS